MVGDATLVTLIAVWVSATLAQLGALGKLIREVTRVKTKLEERTQPVRADGGEAE